MNKKAVKLSVLHLLYYFCFTFQQAGRASFRGGALSDAPGSHEPRFEAPSSHEARFEASGIKILD